MAIEGSYSFVSVTDAGDDEVARGARPDGPQWPGVLLDRFALAPGSYTVDVWTVACPSDGCDGPPSRDGPRDFSVRCEVALAPTEAVRVVVHQGATSTCESAIENDPTSGVATTNVTSPAPVSAASALTPVPLGPVGEVSCGGVRFPLAALDGPGGAEVSDEPAAAALREVLVQQATWADPHAVHAGSWTVVRRDPGSVVFASGAAPRPVVVDAFLALDGVWRVGSSGPCWARRVIDDGEAVYWEPRSIEGEVAVVAVQEMQCSSGASAQGRVRAWIDEAAGGVALAFSIEPLAGAQSCPGAAPTLVEVHLPQPVAPTDLRDAGAVPPAPPCIPDNLFVGCGP